MTPYTQSNNAQSPVLYTRTHDYIPRIAAIHDLCGWGKCSLGVAIPVLSAAGCDVCPVPTGLFSSHTAYPGFYMHDTTEILPSYLDAWDAIDAHADALYSGFLGSASQVELIERLYERFPQALRVLDPVMADHGKVYPTYTSELCEAMAHLTSKAHLVTPNLTEAAIIVGSEYRGTDLSDTEAGNLVERLLARGSKYVVLKGIMRHGEGIIRNFVAGQTMNLQQVSNEYLPYMLHGTGDVYCSCLLASIMAGHDLVSSTAFAGNFTHDCMIVSAKQPSFKERGVSFEPLLGKVAALLA